MAELFLAKQVGLDGFEKVVAIKRILNHLAHERDFVQMFQDEARIVAKLHHPNIVQIYDLGKSGETYFIAMEYIPGRNLSSIGKKAAARGEALPPAHVAQCLSQACEGLHYAHTRQDLNGRPLQIVHRDVSPHNIIVSFSGVVKLVDFGIAKAATKIAHTRAGVLKGKYAYMSPEQIRGERTDGRSDLFAVGIVLYELLCGRRPFEKDNSIQTLKAIVQDRQTPCQALNPGIPDPLAAVIERCLQKSPDARFQTAQEVQLALEAYVSSSPLRVNNLVISEWIKALFADDLAKPDGATVSLPGVGDVVLPDASADDGPRAMPDLALSRGRGGGSVSVRPPIEAPSNAMVTPAPRREPSVAAGRAELIEEGVIERSPGPKTEATGGPPLIDEEGLAAPRGEDPSDIDDGTDDPWEESTVGLPEQEQGRRRDAAHAASNDRGSGPSKGRARRMSHARRALPSASGARDGDVAGPPLASRDPGEAPAEAAEASDPTAEVWAAVEASNGSVNGAGGLGFDDGEGDVIDDGDEWADKTATDRALFEDDDRSAFALGFDPDASIDGVELEVVEGGDDPIVDATVVSPDEATIDHALSNAPKDDATVDEHVLAAPVDPDHAVDPAAPIDAISDGRERRSPRGFSDDRTVAYEDAFADERADEPRERTVVEPSPVDEAPTVAPSAGLPRDQVAAETLADRSVGRLADEPQLPLPRLALGTLEDGRTMAGVTSDFVDAGPEPPEHGTHDPLPSPPAEPPSIGLPAARPAKFNRQAIGAVRLDRRSAAADPLTAFEEAVHPAREAVEAGTEVAEDRGAFEAQFEHSADLVRPSPLEAPPGEEDHTSFQDSYQDEYKALVAPEPLMPASGLGPPIGSTNVPPANLSLSQVLAHPPQVPRAGLTHPPRVMTIDSASVRAASLRSASLVGRQIREVVRSAETPPPTRPMPAERSRSDLRSPLDGPSAEPGADGAPADGRRWLAPVLAGLSVVLLAVAVYLALPYLTGPVGPHLTIKTTPVGARVFVDDTPQRGATPITISGLRPGVTYRIRLERAGFEPIQREVQLPEDGPLIWQIPLRPASEQK